MKINFKKLSRRITDYGKQKALPIFLSTALAVNSLLAGMPVLNIANAVGPATLNTTLPSNGFVCEGFVDFTVSSVANDDIDKMVRGKTTVTSGNTEDLVLQYKEVVGPNAGNYLPLTFDSNDETWFGPSSGFPLSDATSEFKIDYLQSGVYEYTTQLISVDTNETVGAALHSSVTVEDCYVRNVDSGESFQTIQEAIDDAGTDNGDTVKVGAVELNEQVKVTKELHIDGSGRDATIVQGGVGNTGTTFSIEANDVTLSNLQVKDSQFAIMPKNGLDVSGLTLNNIKTVGSSFGLYSEVKSDNPVAFDDVTVIDSSFEDSRIKGIYTERLSNALFDRIVVDGITDDYDITVPSDGIDINLKYNFYQNITITNSTVSNVGKGSQPEKSAAITVKARTDGSYANKSASLDSLTITNTTIKDSYQGLRLGESESAETASPTNVTISGNTFDNNTVYHFNDVTSTPLKAEAVYKANTFQNGSAYTPGESVIWANVDNLLDNLTPNQIVVLGDGVYTRDITINAEGVTLTHGSDPIVVGKISVNADNVTIDGLEINNPAGDRAIQINGVSGTKIINNDINDVGTSSSVNANVHAVYFQDSDGVDASDITISNNTISNIGHDMGKSASAIALGDSTGDSDIEIVTIDGNTISGVVAYHDAEYASGGRGAYGILLNHSGDEHSGKTVDVDITNNTIGNLEGLWVHAIGLEGDIENVEVKHNNISDLREHKQTHESVKDGAGVFFEQNPSFQSTVIESNNFNSDGSWYGVAFHPTFSPNGSLNISGNWWGSASKSDVLANININLPTLAIHSPWLCQPWEQGDRTSADGNGDCDEVPVVESLTVNSTAITKANHATTHPFIHGNNQKIYINLVNPEVVKGGFLQLNKAVEEGNPKNSDRINYSLQKDGEGNWFAEVDTKALEDGVYLFKVEAHGNSTPWGYFGNNSAWTSPNYHLVVDNTAPTISDLEPATGDFVRGVVQVKATVADENLEAYCVLIRTKAGATSLAGNCANANNAGWTNVPEGETTFDVNFEFNSTSHPDLSTYQFAVWARDKAGNTKELKSTNVTVDNTAPSKPQVLGFYKNYDTSSDLIPCGGYTNSTKVQIDWEENNEEDLAGYWFGTKHSQKHKWVESNSYYNANMTPGHNPYHYTVIAVDKAGNESLVSDGCGLVLDQEAPEAPAITSPAPRQWFKSTPIVNSWSEANDDHGVDYYQVGYLYDDEHTFGNSTCEDEKIDGVELSGCRDVHGTSRNHVPSDDEQGGVTIWVRAVDNAGNIGPWSKSVHYYYDHEAPATDINVSEVVDGVFTVSGHASDNLALNRVYVQLVSRVDNARYGGTTINLIPDGDNADWSVTYNIADLGSPEGLYAAHVSVVDMAGNSGSAGWTENFLVELAVEPTLTADYFTVHPDSLGVGFSIDNFDDATSVFVEIFDDEGGLIAQNIGDSDTMVALLNSHSGQISSPFYIPHQDDNDGYWQFGDTDWANVVPSYAIVTVNYGSGDSKSDQVDFVSVNGDDSNVTYESLIAGLVDNGGDDDEVDENSEDDGDALGEQDNKNTIKNIIKKVKQKIANVINHIWSQFGANGQINPDVLASQTSDNEDEEENEDSEEFMAMTGEGGEVAGESAENNVTVIGNAADEGCARFLGLCWYYWIPIAGVVAGGAIYLNNRRLATPTPTRRIQR